MKKIIALILCLVFLFSLSACSNEAENSTETPAAVELENEAAEEKAEQEKPETTPEPEKEAKTKEFSTDALVDALLDKGYMVEENFDAEFGGYGYYATMIMLNEAGKLGCIYVYEDEAGAEGILKATEINLENYSYDCETDITVLECEDEAAAKSLLEQLMAELGTERENVWTERAEEKNIESLLIQEQVLEHHNEGYMRNTVVCRVGSSLLYFECPSLIMNSAPEIQVLQELGCLLLEPVDRSLEPRLSAECDAVLCAGRDYEGNYYELLGVQNESALGFEIKIGVAKNNRWVYPLSNDFPFIAEDGLIHVSVPMGGGSGDGLTSSVTQNIYFNREGAFLLDCYKDSEQALKLYDHSVVIFSLETMQACTVDMDEYSLDYISTEGEYSNGIALNYPVFVTDEAKIVMTQTHRNSVYYDDNTYSVCLLDLHSFERTTVYEQLDMYPVGPYAEGLILCNDQCFYNTSGEKVIDLSEYEFYSTKLARFVDGEYEFVAENSMGSRFNVIIDKVGNVVDEYKIN